MYRVTISKFKSTAVTYILFLPLISDGPIGEAGSFRIGPALFFVGGWLIGFRGKRGNAKHFAGE